MLIRFLGLLLIPLGLATPPLMLAWIISKLNKASGPARFLSKLLIAFAPAITALGLLVIWFALVAIEENGFSGTGIDIAKVVFFTFMALCAIAIVPWFIISVIIFLSTNKR